MATKLQLALQHLQPAVKAFKEGIMPSSGPGCGIMFERCDGQDCTRWMRPRALACACRRSGSTSEGSKQHAATDRFPWVHALHGRGIIAQSASSEIHGEWHSFLPFHSGRRKPRRGGMPCRLQMEDQLGTAWAAPQHAAACLPLQQMRDRGEEGGQ